MEDLILFDLPPQVDADTLRRLVSGRGGLYPLEEKVSTQRLPGHLKGRVLCRKAKIGSSIKDQTLLHPSHLKGMIDLTTSIVNFQAQGTLKAH